MNAANGFRESSTPNTAQRVKAMEKQLTDVRKMGPAILQKLSGDLNQLAQAVSQRLSSIDEVLAVLVEEIGAEEVESRIQARRLKARVADVERSKQAIANGLEKGLLTEAPAVAEDSLIVGFETDSAGAQQNPPFSSLPFAQLQPSLKEKFLNAKAGDRLEIDDGGTFTIEAVYKIEKDKIEAAAAAERDEALKAAAEMPPEVAAEAAAG
jgi:hypothetical protein